MSKGAYSYRNGAKDDFVHFTKERLELICKTALDNNDHEKFYMARQMLWYGIFEGSEDVERIEADFLEKGG